MGKVYSSQRNPRPKSFKLPVPSFSGSHLPEPNLLFCGAREHVSTQHGLITFGPRSLDLKRHPETVRVGIIGTGASIESTITWFQKSSSGVSGDDDHTDFPGFDPDRGFFSKLVIDESLVEKITTREIREIEKPRLRVDRFDALLELVSDKVRLLSQKDSPPEYLVLAMPDELMGLKVVDYRDAELGKVHRDFRRAFKSVAMKYKMATQIMLSRTLEAKPGDRNVDHPSRIAWNLYTGLYFKVGGIPWSPTALEAGTCFVGISFYRPLGDRQNRIRTSVAQAFDEHGDGIVLRGQDFAWDERVQGKSPHLDRDGADKLMSMVLKRYKSEMGQSPRRVVIHKSSRFWNEERDGFLDALGSIKECDLLAVSPTSEIRLLRAGQYPPLRGTCFSISDVNFLYTTGYLAPLKGYPHGHVPSPLQVADHIGDSGIEQLLQEVLTLTKMNWNSAGFAGLMPITIRFSRLVGDIMREIPDEQNPEPQFRYYM